MLSKRVRCTLVLPFLLFVGVTASVWAAQPLGQPPPKTSYYTYYDFTAGNAAITWITCGYNPTDEGCYGSGSIGPFGHACAVAGQGGMVYVLDSDSLVNGSAGGDATLYVYKQRNSSTPSVTLEKTVTLPLAGSLRAHCSMAVLGDDVYLGTDLSVDFYDINLQTYAVEPGVICDTPTTSIYANNQYVIVNQGSCAGYYQKNGGEGGGDGGEVGTQFLPTSNAFIPPGS